jgi:myb proto-oncogene protein
VGGLRTDNSIKNHFYSTIRRCLRRINKLQGEKNSTLKMRSLKPYVLSKILADRGTSRPTQSSPKPFSNSAKSNPTRRIGSSTPNISPPSTR